jgi:hypothetical protein
VLAESWPYIGQSDWHHAGDAGKINEQMMAANSANLKFDSFKLVVFTGNSAHTSYLLDLFTSILQDALSPYGVKHTAGTKPCKVGHRLLGRPAALFHPVNHLLSEAG